MSSASLSSVVTSSSDATARASPAQGIHNYQTSLAMTLRPLAPWLSRPEVTEICINRPGELFVESQSGWQREAMPGATFDWCLRLAKLVAHSTHQRIAEDAPLLSATLPGGERIQIVLLPRQDQVSASHFTEQDPLFAEQSGAFDFAPMLESCSPVQRARPGPHGRNGHCTHDTEAQH